jgi:translocation and assembly module TamB
LSLWGYIWRVGGALLLLVALVVAALMFYASTAHFSNQVRTRVISVLEDATGGRVEIQAMHWNLFHLSVEVDNLTIHGLEAPAEKPYVHIDRLYARAKILSFFGARVGLNFLEVDRPSVHIIVYPDGHTNQPAPKGQQQTNAEVIRTIFDLQADRVEVDNGMALVNQRAVPFQLAANDLGVVVTYAPTSGHYVGEVACSDITVQQGKTPPVRSQLEVHIEAARDEMQLKGLTFTTGKTKLEASGNLQHFNNPQWKLDATGTVALPEFSFLGLVDGFESGTIDLAVTSHGSGAGQFAVDGNAKVVNGGYKIQYFRIYGVNATTRLHVTPDEILLPDLVARPKEGGVVTAVVRFLHYTAADNAPKLADRPTMNIRAQINQIRLTTLLDSLADPGYRRYGFDTTGVGKVDIDWTGAADDLTIAALLTMNAPAKNPPGQLPLSGNVEAKYFQRTGRVEIRKLEAHSPATEMDVSGTLGVWPLNQPSRLDVHMVNHNLGEFDQSLKVLGLGVGKLGISGLPVFIQGEATFDGVGDGSLDDPSFHGHLTATHFFTAFAVPTPGAKTPPVPRMITWDHLDATGGYSSSLISVQQATLRKGETVIHASGQIQSHRISKRKQDFDDQSPITATAQVKNAALPDLLKMAGVDVPATGTVQFDLHAGGTMGNLSGGANLTVQGGDMYGQPYQSLNATVALAGQDINLTHATLLMYGGTVVGNGTYNLQSDKFLANVDGTRFDLAHLPQPKDPRLALAGDLKFDAHASGTFEEPSVLAGIHLRDIMLSGQPAGALELVITTQGNDAVFTGQSSLASAEFQLKGRTALSGDFPTQATLLLTNLNIAPFLRAYKVQSVSGNSAIGGTIQLAGPLKDPTKLTADAEINQFQATLQGINLQSSGPIRATLREGTLRLTQAHITGPDTDVALTGYAEMMGRQELSVLGKGSVNMKLAQTFDPDITSSGHLEFNVTAAGSIRQPFFSGAMHVTNVALALNDVPNGISNLNGNLVFDQNRLQVQDLVGTTGGGQLKLTGFLTYQNGVYGDFTATGKDIRVRYSGISATADTTLHLQGSQTNMLLSGSVQITRFIIGPNVDFASFASNPAADVPPDPTAPSSRLRLDVHVFSAPQLDFQNSYAQLAGSVDLRIRGTLAQPAILGKINVTDGTANFAGTTYRLQHGQIFFTNPVKIEPIIDLDATTRVEEYDVTIGLHGSISHLTPSFRSEPPLPQADVISLLALGRTQEEQQLYSQQEQSIGADSTTNALLGGALNAAVGSRVQKLFGGGSVKIDPTYVGSIGGSSARITVQQNLTRNVQVTYATNVNATAQQLIQAQVDVTQSVSVLAVRDEAGVFSVVLKVHKRYR